MSAPSAPAFFAALVRRMASRVLLEPVPGITLIRPRAYAQTAGMTPRCSRSPLVAAPGEPARRRLAPDGAPEAVHRQKPQAKDGRRPRPVRPGQADSGASVQEQRRNQIVPADEPQADAPVRERP